MQSGIESAPIACALHGFDRTTLAIAAKEQAARSGEFACLDNRAVWQLHLRASGDVKACFDDAFVAKRNTESAICSE